MKRLFILPFLLCTSMVLIAQPRQTQCLNNGWQFSRDAQFTNVETINVPHDFQISQPWVPPAADEKADNTDVAANIKSRLSARGFKEMGLGYYRRTITPDTSLKGRRVLLDFEGIMLVGDVYLNGQRIGGTDYGYVGFELDITQQLRYGGQIGQHACRPLLRASSTLHHYTPKSLCQSLGRVYQPYQSQGDSHARHDL